MTKSLGGLLTACTPPPVTANPGINEPKLFKNYHDLSNTLSVTKIRNFNPKKFDEHPHQVKYGTPPPPQVAPSAQLCVLKPSNQFVILAAISAALTALASLLRVSTNVIEGPGRHLQGVGYHNRKLLPLTVACKTESPCTKLL